MMKNENGAKRQMGEVEKVDWNRVQSWLQEATMALNYCTRLAIVKRTGDAEGMDVAFCGFSWFFGAGCGNI